MKSESHYIFDVMNFDKSLLEIPVNEWNIHEGFIKLKDFLNTLLVINDAAERGIKLASDYKDILTKVGEEKESIIQIVEFTSRKISDCKKNNSEFFWSWFQLLMKSF